MTWLILALMAPLCWSIANYLDKYLLSRQNGLVGNGSGGLLILSSLMSLLFAGCVILINGASFVSADSQIIGVLIFSGVFEALYILFYFWALERENTTTVISLFQFAPVMGLLFGFFILNEIPDAKQIFAIILILIGTLFIILNNGEKFSLKKNILAFMLVSTVFVGLYSTLFRLVGDSISFWPAIFWQYIGIGLVGFVIFITIPIYRRQTIDMLTKNKAKPVILTGVAEIMNIGAVLLINAAVLLAPVALVLSVSSVQPIFVLIEGALLAYFFPKAFASEKPSFKLQYILGIIIVCIGGFIIY